MRFAGYAAVFDSPDRGGDVVRAGAFARGLKAGVPILWQHDARQRIWADGKLLRGEAGDFKTQTGFRFYSGSEGQSADPLIAASEGVGACPAYRGIAYAMFEDFQLADYGNRIPSLSFEVIADEVPVETGLILETLAPGLVAEATTLLGGLAATGDSARGVIGTLSDLVPLSAADDGSDLLIREGAVIAPPLVPDDLGARVSGSAPRISFERASSGSLPQRMTLAYYDLNRDYLQGSQSVSRPGSAVREVRSELAASLTPAQAKGLLSARLTRDVAGRETAKVTLPWRYAGLLPGQSLTLPETPGSWLISEASLEAMVVRLTLKRLASPAQLALGADPGRGVYENDLLIGSTLLALLDLPWLGTGLANTPSVFVAAAGTGSGWRSAALLQSSNGGVTVEEVGATAPPAVLGTATGLLGPGTPHVVDRASIVDIALVHSGMVLANSDLPGLLAGQNIALLGDELIQFERAEPLGSATYRLSGLLRGRRGTEAAIAAHVMGERFVLIENDALAPLTVPAGVGALQVWASGVGDGVPVQASLATPGLALRPLSPAHLRIERGTDWQIGWTRRSRDGWRWDDFVDAPLGEESERYGLVVTPDVGAVRTFETAGPVWSYTAAERAADLSAGATSLSLSVQQIGTYGLSLPSLFTFSLT